MNYRSRIFGSGMFYKNALVIAVPIMLQQLIQSLVSLIDNFMVSGLGDVSMSGVNVAVKAADFVKINRKQFKETLVKGSLVLFCEMVWVLSETITTAIYNGRGGADVVSGMASGFAIANLFFVAFGGIYSATGVILGKTLGAGDLEEARREKTWLLSGSAVFGLLMMAFGFGTTLIVPVVFGRLSPSAVTICRNMVILMALFMPVWVYMNTQQAVARAGGDTAMGAYADSLLTLFVMIPMVILLGRYTVIGPVGMYGCVKLIDLIKVAVFHVWLKKERWLKNLTGMESAARG